jgi:hypothetical protein
MALIAGTENNSPLTRLEAARHPAQIDSQPAEKTRNPLERDLLHPVRKVMLMDMP